MKIVYSPHLIRRLQQRDIPVSYPETILKSATKKYFDTLTLRHIAIKKLRYAGKLRSMVVVYDIINEVYELVTIHPISDSEIENKAQSGRWKVYEKQ
jgi:hypothetical protein